VRMLGLHRHDDAPEPLPALRRRLLVAGLVLLALAAVLTAVVAIRPGVVQGLDDWFLHEVEETRWAPLVAVSKALSTIFGTMVLWPVRAVVTLVIALRRHWLALAAWVCTVALSEAAIGPVKALVDRPRPPGSLIATTGASYPSGHAMASAVTAIGVVMALTSGRTRLHGMVVAVLVTSTVALSRPYLGAHWLSDVVGGALIGAGLALAVPEAFEVARDRRRARGRVSGGAAAPPRAA
jgi:membrane-associated phospholipid phosphatase